MERACSLWLFCLLTVLWKGAAGEFGDPILKKAGEDAVLRWKLPASTTAQIITIALQLKNGTRPVFYGSTQQAGMIQLGKLYEDRVDVLDSLSIDPGDVTFTLKNVMAEDAGRYICINGFGNEPVISDCGQMLVIIGTPENTAVSASTVAVENEDLTLECGATSTSLPPDHNLPCRCSGSILQGPRCPAMRRKYRWTVGGCWFDPSSVTTRACSSPVVRRTGWICGLNRATPTP